MIQDDDSNNKDNYDTNYIKGNNNINNDDYYDNETMIRMMKIMIRLL